MASFYEHCPVTQEKIVDFLLEELSYQETAALDNHLRECESCSALVESYVNLFKDVRAIEAPPVSTKTYFNLKQRVFVTGKQNTVKKKKEPYLQMFSLLLSAAAVLLFITMFSENVFNSEVPEAELPVNESWFIDTMLISAIPAQAHSHDSLVFINNFFVSTQQLIISMPNILTKFYFFTSDMLAQYPARNATIPLKPFDLIHLFHKQQKNISNTPEPETQCICFSFRESMRTV